MEGEETEKESEGKPENDKSNGTQLDAAAFKSKLGHHEPRSLRIL